LETNIHKSIVNVLTYALRQFALTGLLKNQLLKLEGEHIHSFYRKIIWNRSENVFKTFIFLPKTFWSIHYIAQVIESIRLNECCLSTCDSWG